MAKFEELLGEEEKDTPSESSTEKEPDGTEEDTSKKTSAVDEYEALQKRIEGLKKEEEKVLSSLKSAREQRRNERVKPEVKQEPGQDSTDLSTAEGWDKHIQKTAEQKVAPVLSELEKFKARQRQKAVSKFVSDHPEYGTEKDTDDEALSALEDLAKRIKGDITELDAEDYLESLKDAWAVKNRSRIEEQERKYRTERQRADEDEAELASSSGATSEREESNPTLNASKSDLRAAKVAGMSLEKYMKLKRQMEEMEV